MSIAQLTDLLEALTILCFGLSWPISIRKSYISRTAKGKSSRNFTSSIESFWIDCPSLPW